MITTTILAIALLFQTPPDSSAPRPPTQAELKQRAQAERAKQIQKNKITKHAKRAREAAALMRARGLRPATKPEPELPGEPRSPRVGETIVLDRDAHEATGKTLVWISEASAALITGAREVERGTKGKVVSRYASASGVYIYGVVLDGYGSDVYYVREGTNNIRVVMPASPPPTSPPASSR